MSERANRRGGASKRRKRVRELHARGLTYRQIAAELGISTATIHKDLHYTEPERAPARHYKWEPFKPGNAANLQHGAQSPELVEARARELVPAILEHSPHLDAARDGPAIFRYATSLARCERVYRWLSMQPDPVFVDVESGEPHGVFERLERWERASDVAEERLAIAPLTRARLGLDLMTARRSLEDELAEGREAWRETREAQ